LPSGLPPVPPFVLNNEPLPSLMQNKFPNSVSPAPLSGTLPSAPPLPAAATTGPEVNVTIPPMPNKPNALSGANLSYQGMSHLTESPTPSLITPGQLLQSGQAGVVPSQSSQAVYKDVEQAPAPPPPPAPAPAPAPTHTHAPAPAFAPSPAPASAQAPTPAPAFAPAPAPSADLSTPVSVPADAQPPILPLPTQHRNAPKTNGAPYQNRHSYRGRERGRGSGVFSLFLEEFDFTAMNEKFNKDEVWGTLGKSNKRDGDASDKDELEEENDIALPKIDVKPVYSKDDFFDTLSCNNENRSNNGRTRFSEQMKLDTETFGEFSNRYRGGRGGRGPYRGGGGRFRGGGYQGRGYGYVSRGRGGRNQTSDY
nr:hypothetical protein [Tanacetum cinerariifolium]